MRDGSRVLTAEKKETSIDDVRSMLGRSFTEEFPKAGAKIGSSVLEVSNLTRSHAVRDVSFEVRKLEK